MKTSFRQNLLASTLLVGTSALATPAWAQDTQSADPAASQPTDGAAAGSEGGSEEEVVDAEFSEVDEDAKG